MVTSPPTAHEIAPAEALRIFKGITAAQWAQIDREVPRRVLRDAWAQDTPEGRAILIVRAATRRGILATRAEDDA